MSRLKSPTPPSNSRNAERIAEAVAQATGHGVRASGEFGIGPLLRAQRFVLDNGLVLILCADTRAQTFTYQSWFAVGSRDEDPQRTGLAHLFEHLMFKGTTTYPTGTFDREMEKRGAQTNAATWVDWTYYTQSLSTHADNFERVVAFEADRMVNLVLDDETFASELEVVKNERRLSVEDNMGGLLSEELSALTYAVHPYRWPTIGSMAHLEAASVADLKAFYRRFYAPNNATVVVVGNFAPEAALTTLTRAYAELVPQDIARRARKREKAQKAARYKHLIKPVVAPQVTLGFVVVPQLHPHHAALEMLCIILTAGDTGRLTEALVTKLRLASTVSGFLTPFGDPGLFEIHITVNPGVRLAEVIARTLEVIESLGEHIEPHELAKARNGLTLGLWDSLKDAEGLAESLGHHQVVCGDAALLMATAPQYKDATAQSLMKVARRYLRNERVNVVSVADKDSEAPC